MVARSGGTLMESGETVVRLDSRGTEKEKTGTGVRIGTDICGTLRTLYETGMGEVDGIYGKKVFIVLEDNELSSGWGNKALTCCLHSACVEPTLIAYEAVSEAEGIFVVIQYVIPSFSVDGGLPTVTSYFDATIVFFDPHFPTVLHHRKQMLGERYLAPAPGPLSDSLE